MMDSISRRRVEPIPRSSLDAMEISSSKVPDEEDEDEDDDEDERETFATFLPRRREKVVPLEVQREQQHFSRRV
jgi:hypothetical protein